MQPAAAGNPQGAAISATVYGKHNVVLYTILAIGF